MDSSPGNSITQPSLPSMAGVKRPPPTLLPAFEPFSSSPGFPRFKRRAPSSPTHQEAFRKYPTPVPTSTTGILSSSPPRVQLPRSGLPRTQTSFSERAPLATVPTVTLPENGGDFLMGRSSNSSNYQLSTNHLISRVHVKARYVAAPTPLERSKVEILCTGWNGVTIHCHGRTWQLAKGDTFTSETESAEIMLDVQDARVLVGWPSREQNVASSDESWDDDNSPRSQQSAVNARLQPLQSSPLRLGQRLISPESPTPVGPGSGPTNLADLFREPSPEAIVQVYEDETSGNGPLNEGVVDLEVSHKSTEVLPQSKDFVDSQSSELSEPDEDNPDEENDPIVHSFGPFGADISSRMASITAVGSPEKARGRDSEKSSPLSSPGERSASASTNDADPIPIVNHVVNQLAFSRLSSTPLSVILNHLPSELKNSNPTDTENHGLLKEDLQKYMNATPCIGEIHREGKDAAGKQLESEYYYIPEEDRDEERRAAVVDGLRKPTLRNCRKSHKQYYWKRPRTP